MNLGLNQNLVEGINVWVVFFSVFLHSLVLIFLCTKLQDILLVIKSEVNNIITIMGECKYCSKISAFHLRRIGEITKKKLQLDF